MKLKDIDTKKFEYFCSCAAAWMGILLLGVLFLYGLFYTQEHISNEHSVFQTVRTAAPLMLAYTALAAAAAHFAAKLLLGKKEHQERNLRILLASVCVYVGVLGFAWAALCSYQMDWDAQMLSFYGEQFASGLREFDAYDIDYITAYPHQLGMIALAELLYRLFGAGNYRAFQALNALGASGIVFAGYQIVRELTDRKEPAAYFLLLMPFCWPVMIYVAFFYGEILSILFSLLSVYALLVYLRRKRKRDILYMALAVTLACLIRINCYILLIAMGCVLVVKAVSGKKLCHLLALSSCVLCCLLAHFALVKIYEQRTDLDLEHGMPAVVYLAMGSREGMDGREAGWYNLAYSWDLFVRQAGKNQEQAKELAGEVIEESVEIFRGDPAYMLDFYKRKIVSQWNEPTYSCLKETAGHEDARARIMDSLYEGRLWKPFVRFMDVFQSLIYGGALLFLLLRARRKIPVEHLTLLIAIIGGFIFYIFWEAKSRYTLPYFVMMIPMAAAGWELLAQKAAELLKRQRDRFLAFLGKSGKERGKTDAET